MLLYEHKDIWQIMRKKMKREEWGQEAPNVSLHHTNWREIEQQSINELKNNLGS